MIHAPGRRTFFRNCACCIAPSGLSAAAVDRRSFLTASAAAFGSMAAPAVLGLSGALAQAKPHRIDVHHHVAPPTWLDAMDVIGRKDPPLSNWSVQKIARGHGQGRRRNRR